jgi:hypothetical protein
MTSEPLDPESFRSLIDLVKWGECITFPNGLIVDKRMIPPPPPVWQPSPVYPLDVHPFNVV